MKALKKIIKKSWKKFLRFFWRKYSGGTTPLTLEEYRNYLINVPLEQKKLAYEKAWESKKFEIENYWKRATYFWTFLVPVFAGYFAILNSNGYSKPDKLNHIEVYLVICIGFVISVAWALVNNGSKAWQRN